jgi:diacylglycerol kinase family enzyme
MLANCGLLPANILLLPQAVIDDGVLDFVVIRPKGMFGWLRLGTKIVTDGGIYRSLSTTGALSKDGRKVRTLRYFRGETLVATVDTPSIMQLDGDGFGEVTGFSVTTRPGALTIRVSELPAVDDGAQRADQASTEAAA